MAPAMEKEGIVAPGEIDPATFPRRMSEEVERLASVVIGRSENWRLVAQAVTVSRPDQERCRCQAASCYLARRVSGSNVEAVGSEQRRSLCLHSASGDGAQPTSRRGT
jgi:hypothetical protein